MGEREERYGDAVVYGKDGAILYNISEISEILQLANKKRKRDAEHDNIKLTPLSHFDVRTVLQVLRDHGY